MKKLLISFTLMFSIAGIANAYYNENETYTVNSLLRQGYSKSTAQVVDSAVYHSQGKNGTYKRVFQTKEKNPYTKIKNYVDPFQDDGKFGEHEIEYSNTWTGDLTRYAFPYSSNNNREVDNL